MRPGRLRAHLSYANVTATLALFVALGGSAYAVKRIDGKDIAARTIPAGKLKRESLTQEEIGPRAIGRSELSRSLREALRQEDEPGLPGADGYPGEPGVPGEPGPPGTACDPTGLRLCADDELPGGDTLTLTVQGFAAEIALDPAYRAGCAGAPAVCTMLVQGALPTPAAVDAWYRDAAAGQPSATRDVQLTVRSSGGAVVAALAGPDGRPSGLVRHGDRFQLAIAVDDVRQTAP